MSKSLLQQLYDGEIYPAECVFPNESKDKKLNRNISNETKYFQSILSPENWKRFEQLDNMKSDRTLDYQYAFFAYGFRLAVGLIIEGLGNGEKIVLNTN